MTAAFGELTGPVLRGRAGRVLCVLALVLPVPLFAALGLSLPLPATVERIAAKLVPFADSTSLAGGVDGSIALAPGEGRAETHAAAIAPTTSARGAAGIKSQEGHPVTDLAVVRPGPRTGDVDEPRATTPAGETERPPAPSLPQQTADGVTPTPTPTPTPSSGGGSSGGTQTGGGGSNPGGSQPVETVTNTANGAVETVTTAVSDATESVEETTKGAVDSATDAGSGALGGIKPP